MQVYGKDLNSARELKAQTPPSAHKEQSGEHIHNVQAEFRKIADAKSLSRISVPGILRASKSDELHGKDDKTSPSSVLPPHSHTIFSMSPGEASGVDLHLSRHVLLSLLK